MAVELAKCAADAAYFCDQFLTIDDAQGHGEEPTGTMPFHLWPAQVPVMWKLVTERLLIILKARQLGISWICCAYALWLCLFNSGKMVLCFSQGQAEANELIRRIKALYDRLPEWMKSALPGMVKDNTEQLEWGNGSRVYSMPATKNAGRTFTASLVLLDEAAFLQYANALYTSLKPTIDAGGQLVVLSTANGLGNLFHLLWTRAVAKANAFKTIFLPWWARPDRTQAWYRRTVSEATDPEKVKQEYPATANEAFIASGRYRFKPGWIAAQSGNIRDPICLDARSGGDESFDALRALALRCESGGNQLFIYAMPVPGRRYLIGADVAEGLADGDYSGAVAIDEESWEEVACLHGHWEPDEYAAHLADLGNIFNRAPVAVERNNHGHATIAALKRDPIRYPFIANGPDEKPGWLSNVKTKPQSIDTLAESMRDVACTVHTQMALDEIQIYEVKDNGETGAPEGYFDDLVMAWAIVLSVARMPKMHETPLLTPLQLMAGIKRAAR